MPQFDFGAVIFQRESLRRPLPASLDFLTSTTFLLTDTCHDGVHNRMCHSEAALLGLIEDHGAEDISPFCLAAPAPVAVASLYAISVAERASPLRRQITRRADTGPPDALRRPQTALLSRRSGYPGDAGLPHG
jgi:hypothetical protein